VNIEVTAAPTWLIEDVIAGTGLRRSNSAIAKDVCLMTFFAASIFLSP